MIAVNAGMFQMRATETGAGPTVMIVHSSGMGPMMWRAYPELLAVDHRVVTPALLGYRPSDAVPRGSVGLAALDLAALRALLVQQPGPVHLVGHSYGGTLAARLALVEPLRVTTLALLEPVLYGALAMSGDVAGAADLRALRENPLFLDEERGGTEEWLRLFVDYWNRPGAWDALPAPARDAFLAAGWKIFEEVRSVSGEEEGFDRYRFPMRTLLMGGAASPVGAHRVIARLAEVNPGASVVELPDAGHMFPVTHRREVVARLRAHWAA